MNSNKMRFFKADFPQKIKQSMIINSKLLFFYICLQILNWYKNIITTPQFAQQKYIDMAPPSAGAQRMNRFLRQRRKKIEVTKGFRKQRILKHYHKAKQSYENQLQERQQAKLQNGIKSQNTDEANKQIDPQVQRKINFYNEVFNQPHVNEHIPKAKKKKNKKNKNKGEILQVIPKKDEKTLTIEKLQHLKEKKVKFIKKMKHQKTDKGQPVMRNMIKYALTKIQEDIQKDKLSKISKQQQAKFALKNQNNKTEPSSGKHESASSRYYPQPSRFGQFSQNRQQSPSYNKYPSSKQKGSGSYAKR